ncbi:hypothetical protein B0T16DRAFT_371477 [Cercophora newfieldiana]|uniref:NACHT domain-containing protein n=1 Tax=Cercophora newfieldiana TaxID=92897 RepID=A0AA39YC45_9PEZI|nr:hypothetical protein B0T16DRAFT_371477 [Cercophora newfieldiana]
MDLANVSQAIFSAKWAVVFYLVLTGGTILTCLWLLRTRRAQDPILSPQQGPRLQQVYPTKDDPEEGRPGPDIDIIAIHGLDTNSPGTWEWKVPSNRKTGDPATEVNWLANPDMLPAVIKINEVRARIFTCDWPAQLLQKSSVPITLPESAQSLRGSIIQHLKANTTRPILFIASCLGGIILIKALEIDNQHTKDNTDSPSLTRATRGVVFLATPFRGTAFQNMPGFLLKILASMQDQTVTALIDTLGATPDLDELTKGFITLTTNHDYHVVMFWEARNTVLLRKFHLAWMVSTWTLPGWLLVNKHSATLGDFDSQRLDRSHVMMNKFAHSKCLEECKKDCTESEDFSHVSRKIGEILEKIREGSPLEQADVWIRKRHYTPERLKIERLSGDTLPMDRCYINLAIVVDTKTPRQQEEGSGKDVAPHTSSFSLAARLKVETPDESIQVQLSSLFDPRKDSNGQMIHPRRVLIRGRAGVGKTTLCKKMVDGFPTDEFRKWNELFDRVLWVPLRRLKEWSPAQYDLEELFSHEYFAGQQNRETRATFAKELQRIVESGRTLFILDGLDEIAQELSCGNHKSDFLCLLLDQPNAIITSRPHVQLPAGVRPPDLELETIGFYPDQVKDYLRATFTDPEKVKEVQSYLEAHQLIQSLVRIPIQLDALCYTWDSFGDKTKPQTMTAVYKAIEGSLWKKDIVRLGKKETGDQIKTASRKTIERLVEPEICFLECLAFLGLHDDVIDFDSKLRNRVSDRFAPNLTLDEVLPGLSFLRTSDPSSKHRDQNYHFLHLTFQEYFAARYFVRRWKAEKPLTCLQLSDGDCNSIAFLQKHKYDPRYDIFWRFVAGLLDAGGEALSFFQTVEKEPRDLLGPTHQRLVMHCLSEVERKESTFTELREKLETQLEQWLLFECAFTRSSRLAREMECPEQVLVKALKQATEDTRPILLESLSRRTTVPSSVIDVASPWLSDCVSELLCIAILHVLRHQHKGLPDTILQGIAARLEDKDRDVRQAAIEALQGQANPTDEMLQGIAARLKDKNGYVRRAAIEALQGRADLTEEMLQGIAARLEDKDGDVRRAAIRALQGRADLTDEMLQGIAARLEDKDGDVRWAAIRALQGRADLTDEMLQGIAARLEDKDRNVRWTAIEALQSQADLTEEMLQGIAARLEDKDGYVRQAAIGALQGRADLTEEMLQGIAARLKDKDGYVRRAAIEALQGRANLTEEMLQGIATRLKDKDGYIRRAAIEALQSRANLTEEMLQGIAAQLEDKDWDIRQAAIKALQGQADLTEEMLQGITAQLKHKDKYVQRAAIEALQNRANLTEEMLQGIATQLKHEDWDVRQAVIKMFLNQAALSLNILSPYAKPLYKALLKKSFTGHFYWYASNSGFIGVDLKHISLGGGDQRPPLHLAAGNWEEEVGKLLQLKL